MRPVERGPCPRDGDDDVVFAEYGHARPHLILRFGDYCSFCESPLLTPDVEHIRHKDGNPDLERTWSNFLLACKSCNSTKATRVGTAAQVAAHLWPDQDRTFHAFVYTDGGMVKVAAADPELLATAQALASLVGLLKRPGEGLTAEQERKASDRRWQKRYECWNAAVDSREDLSRCPTTEQRRQILRTARAQGFWSVWLTVFREDAEMVAELIAAFPGTATARLLPLPSPA